MKLLRFILPLRRFQWCRRHLGGRWELWKGRTRPNRIEWVWLESERVGKWHAAFWSNAEVLAVEDYTVTRIDTSHVPEQR